MKIHIELVRWQDGEASPYSGDVIVVAAGALPSWHEMSKMPNMVKLSIRGTDLYVDREELIQALTAMRPVCNDVPLLRNDRPVEWTPVI